MAAPNLPAWQRLVLRGVGAPASQENVKFLNAWVQAEGGDASNNPFNTTQQAAGASSYNSVGVRNYTSPQQGVQATVETLNNGRYGNILAALRKGNSAAADASALAHSPWGTGSLVQKVLGTGDVAGTLDPAAAGIGALGAESANSLAASALLDMSQRTLEGQGPDPSSLIGLMVARQSMGAAASTYGATPSAGTPVKTTAGGSGDVRGIAEAFYDPLGSYDTDGGSVGHFGGPIGGHSDHVHLSFSTPQEALKAISSAENLGLTVRENPYVDKVDPVHVSDSYHYRTFPGLFNGKHLGQAIDASGPADRMAALFRMFTPAQKK